MRVGVFKLCLQHVTHDKNVTNTTHCEWVCAGVRRCLRVCTGVRRCLQVCKGLRGRDKFSEYLLENRFITSANYNLHPLRIFYFLFFCAVIFSTFLFLPSFLAFEWFSTHSWNECKRVSNQVQFFKKISSWTCTFCISSRAVWYLENKNPL